MTKNIKGKGIVDSHLSCVIIDNNFVFVVKLNINLKEFDSFFNRFNWIYSFGLDFIKTVTISYYLTNTESTFIYRVLLLFNVHTAEVVILTWNGQGNCCILYLSLEVLHQRNLIDFCNTFPMAFSIRHSKPCKRIHQ